MAALKVPKTYVAKPAELQPRWHLFNAQEKPLGRLATEIATILQGKHRPIYTPTLNTGDFIVVINAAKIQFTGNKGEKKEYNFHSQYPGGLRTFTLKQMIQRNPARVVELAVRGMLPKTTLGRQMLKRLKVYARGEHPHQAQLTGYGSDQQVKGIEPTPGNQGGDL